MRLAEGSGTLGGVRLALLLVALPGCYCSHAVEPPDGGTDAPLDVGADGGGRDAGPEGERHWVLVEGSFFELTSERCELREGATAILRVRGTMNLCDEPANVRWSIDHAARRITLTPAIWRPVGGPSCPPGTATFELDVSLVGETLEPGAWEAVLADGSARAAFTVAEGPPELTCTDCRAAGESCAVDEECAGPLRCVAMRGDAVCASMCALPCDPVPWGHTGPDATCSVLLGSPATCDDDPTFGRLCHPVASSSCGECPPGMTCSDVRPWCDWDYPLVFESIARSCRTDADCAPGLSCVGGVSCGTRCVGVHVCPGGTFCDATTVACPFLIEG